MHLFVANFTVKLDYYKIQHLELYSVIISFLLDPFLLLI